jgi:hypothetical protein
MTKNNQIVMISLKLKAAVKLSPLRQYQIAIEAGVHPVTLSQILSGYLRPKSMDKRVVRIGRVVGLRPEECFQQPWDKKFRKDD